MPGVIKLNPDSILYDEDGNAVGVVLDGSVYRLQTETKIATGHGLATEAKQDTLETTLTEIEADTDNLDIALSTRATEATLASLESKDFATETTLSGIDSTTSSIFTELQAKTEPNDLQKAVLHDSSGIEIDSETVSGVHRLKTSAWTDIYSEGDGPVDVVTDVNDVKRLAVDAKFPPGQAVIVGNAIDPDLSLIRRDYVRSIGGDISMRVDGSVSGVEFTFDADDTYDTELYELRFILGTQDILFDGVSFGSLTSLTNGVLIEITADGTTTEIANIQSNEDLLMFPTPANYLLNNTGPKDILVMGISLGGAPVLRAGSDDKIKVTIRDKLDGGGVTSIATFRAQVFGLKKAV